MREIAAVGLLAIIIGFAVQADSPFVRQVHGPGVIEKPVMNLPLSLRQSNWVRYGSGSCVIASMVSCLRWQGQDELADRMQRNYGGGQNWDSMVAALEAEGVIWAGTVGEGDVAFLEQCHATRRGCIVTWSPRHVVTLVHFDAQWAGILDNNDVERIKWIPRDDFVREWISRGSWAMTPVYSPAAPIGS